MEADASTEHQEGIGHACLFLFFTVLSLKLYLVFCNFLMVCKWANESQLNTLLNTYIRKMELWYTKISITLGDIQKENQNLQLL